jgi:hypothetical protein
MKIIKRLGKEYYKPNTNEVDWSKVIGKNCVIDCSTCTGESGAYSELLIEDFDHNTQLLKYKFDGDSFWVEEGFYGTWVLMFVFENEEPVKKSTLSDEMKLLLEHAKERTEDNQQRPFYPPPWPTIPKPYYNKGIRCSKCGIDFGNGPIGYVCPNHPCPSGLGGVYCYNSIVKEYPSEYDTGCATGSLYAD